MAESKAPARRRALLFGNREYKDMAELRRAIDDTITVQKSLVKLGFVEANIKRKSNLKAQGMKNALDAFVQETEPEDVVCFSCCCTRLPIGADIFTHLLHHMVKTASLSLAF